MELGGPGPGTEPPEGALGGVDRRGGQQRRGELEHLVLHQAQLNNVKGMDLQLSEHYPLRIQMEEWKNRATKKKTEDGDDDEDTSLSDSAAFRNLLMKT